MKVNGNTAEGSSGSTHSDQPPQGAQDAPHLWPDDTPLAEMTDAQRAAYWAHQAQKYEETAKARADYDQVKAERDQLLESAKSDTDKALDAARAEGKAQAQAELHSQLVGVYISAKLGKAASPIAAAINPQVFIAEDGSLKTQELDELLSGWAPKTALLRDPHQGRQPARRPSGMQAGRDLARPKKTTT